MAALTREEVVAGTVVQLDADGLRASGHSKTNAEKTQNEDRAVAGNHSFLILKVDSAAGVASLVPIFSGCAPGSEQLQENLKSGYRARWFGVDLFFNKWQHWETPIEQIVHHSTVEDTPAGNRRTYATTDTTELEWILEFSTKNRAPWRDLS